MLEQLAAAGLVQLAPIGKDTRTAATTPMITVATAPPAPAAGKLRDFEPITLEPIHGAEAVSLWNEYVHRYQPLGYKRPFGAHQRYFIWGNRGEKRLDCFLFAAAAWALEDGDQWIGWTAAERGRNINYIVNDFRFLIFPWVRVPNLVGKALSVVAKRIADDWQARYGFAPVLLDTFVDTTMYSGGCYRAANWIEVGKTAGPWRSPERIRELVTRQHQLSLV